MIDYNNYLKKYEDTYKIERAEDGIWVIKSKIGNIQPFGVNSEFLCFYGDLLIKGKKTRFIKRLPSFCLVIQEAETEIVVKFPENQLESLSKLFKLSKRKNLSQEQRQRRADNMNKVRQNIGKSK